ncbi:MAG: Nif3-like dinuclear metal center hexameric protein [Gammaproteobacteria bacterium]|nr:Nif3-like dinuclear metal center hexameric protein [Gammaproteobacteria bacterium]
MPVNLKDLDETLKTVLKPELFNDYCPNGIQVEGKEIVAKIVTGVTASKALIEAAIYENADLVLVHHGYFWKGENPSITGLKKVRLKLLLENNISLCAYHLPLDAHPKLGNNAQLAKVLSLSTQTIQSTSEGHPIIYFGSIERPMNFDNFSAHIESKLNRKPLSVKGNNELIKTLAWCTGAAQGLIEHAIDAGVDAYITGEISEQTVHMARESGLHLFSAGHHATERYGVQALGSYLENQFDIVHSYIDIDNPV